MSLGMSRTVVGVERVVGRWVARSQSLAFARIADGHIVRWRPSHGDHMAPRGRGERRLSRLLLLSYLRGTQERIDCDSTGSTSAAHLALAKASAAGDRRFAHQAVRAKSRRGRCPSQPDAGPSRPAVSVRTRLGDDFVGAEAPRVGTTGVAVANDALRPPADYGDDSPSRAVGSGLPPSCNWRLVWSNGSFPC